jgi:choline dehydrogenase-like flavoprotein
MPKRAGPQGVRYVDSATRDVREVRARIVILCAQALESTRILFNSANRQFPNGLANSSGVLGHYLMDHISGYGASGTYTDGKLRTTNVIERCFVEVRRRTRPMVCFVNAASMDRIIYAIFSKFNGQWRDRTLRIFTQAA